MNDLMFINSFEFKNVKFANSQNVDYADGIKYNCVIQIKKGVAEFVSEDKTIFAKAKDIIHISRGVKYHSYWYGSPDVSFNSYSYLNTLCDVPIMIGIHGIEPSSKIEKLLSDVPLDGEISFYSVGKFYLFLDQFYQKLKDIHLGHDQELLKEAMEYIISNPHCRVSDIAKSCNVGETKLYEVFKSANMTPNQFKLHVRLKQAVDYLVSTDKSVEEISQLCGFSTSSYFRKKFFEKYGLTPREMRKNSMI